MQDSLKGDKGTTLGIINRNEIYGPGVGPSSSLSTSFRGLLLLLLCMGAGQYVAVFANTPRGFIKESETNTQKRSWSRGQEVNVVCWKMDDDGIWWPRRRRKRKGCSSSTPPGPAMQETHKFTERLSSLLSCACFSFLPP